MNTQQKSPLVKIPIQNIPIELRQAIENRIQKDVEACQKWGLTMEQVANMRKYGQSLKKKYPWMSDMRISKKVAAYFKITLTNGPNNKPIAIIGKKNNS